MSRSGDEFKEHLIVALPAEKTYIRNAEVAQLVERLLAKEKVAGSNPVFRSSKLGEPGLRLARFCLPNLWGPDSQVAKAAVCKTAIHGFDSRSGLHFYCPRFAVPAPVLRIAVLQHVLRHFPGDFRYVQGVVGIDGEVGCDTLVNTSEVCHERRLHFL